MNLPSFAAFYTTPGPMTEPGPYGPLLDSLPNTLPELVRALQGLAVHIFWAKRYGLDLSEERQAEVGLRLMRQVLRSHVEQLVLARFRVLRECCLRFFQRLAEADFRFPDDDAREDS